MRMRAVVFAAGILLGQVVRYEIANVYNPAYSVVCRLPWAALPPRRVVPPGLSATGGPPTA